MIIIGRKAEPNKYIEHEDYWEMVIDSPTYGYFNILFDKDDYEKVKQHAWCVQRCWNKKTNLKPKYYAMTTVWDGGVGKDRKTHGVLMHRYLVNAPKGKSVDHMNFNEQDNRKTNLRICSQSENRQNYRGVNPNNTSGHIGVTWDKTNKRWFAHIRVNWKQKNLGLYENIEDAIAARKAGEEKYFTIHNDVVA